MLKVALDTFEFWQSHVFSSHFATPVNWGYSKSMSQILTEDTQVYDPKFWAKLQSWVLPNNIRKLQPLYRVVFTLSSSTCLWKSSPIPTICSGIHCIEPSFCCANAFQPESKYDVAVRSASTVFPWNRLRLVVFVLVLLSDVLGVGVLLLVPTASGDGAGPRFCASLPPSSPRFRGGQKIRSVFRTNQFFTLFFLLGDPLLKY